MMRSFARARSSSRRAPPKAASKPCSAIASSSVVVCRRLRDARGPVSSTTRPASIESCTLATIRRSPSSATRRSRNSMTSGKLWPVSTCMSGNGKRAGRKAFSARRSSTIESLPPLNSSTGRSSSAATSRMTWMASASRARRWVSSWARRSCGAGLRGRRPRSAAARDAARQPRRHGDRHADDAPRREVDAGLGEHAERRAQQHTAQRGRAGRPPARVPSSAVPISTPGSEPTRMFAISTRSTLPDRRVRQAGGPQQQRRVEDVGARRRGGA